MAMCRRMQWPILAIWSTLAGRSICSIDRRIKRTVTGIACKSEVSDRNEASYTFAFYHFGCRETTAPLAMWTLPDGRTNTIAIWGRYTQSAHIRNITRRWSTVKLVAISVGASKNDVRKKMKADFDGPSKTHTKISVSTTLVTLLYTFPNLCLRLF